MKMRRIAALAAAVSLTVTGMPNISAATTVSVAQPQAEKILYGAVYTVTNLKSGKLLTADPDGNVCQREHTDADTQHWQIVPARDGCCKLVSADEPHMVLTIDDAAVPNGGNISVAADQNADTQLFQIHAEGKNYYISTKCSDHVSAVDIKGKSNADGANVHQYKYQGNDNQIFTIVPVNNTYTWLKADFDFDCAWTAADLSYMKRGLLGGFDEISEKLADLNQDGTADAADAVLLQSYLLGQGISVDSVTYSMPYPAAVNPTPTDGRQMEYLNRGVVAVSTGKDVFVSWRSLVTDSPDTAFNVYRTTDGKTEKLNAEPLTGGTNFTDTKADLAKDHNYFVKAVVGGVETETDGSYTLAKNSVAQTITVPIKAGSVIHFVWTGDFNGDGAYDFLVDRCTDDHQKLEAYLNDGTYLWTIDLGYNSENKNNISPGASTIDVGMWDGATVYDMDCDGYADILLRAADGVTFGDGTVYRNSVPNGQAIVVIDGRTGALKAEAPVPDDYISVGPMACMMEVGYLDGVHPSLICWMKNRNKDKTFNSMTAAYTYTNGKWGLQWKYLNEIIFDDRTEYKNGYAEAHQIRVADVDYDGKDEVLHMGYCLNGDGTLRYHIDEVVHGDRWFVGSFCNANNQKEMYGYGIQQDNQYGLLEYFYNASTGELLWTNYAAEGTADVGRGNIGDIDPTREGFEVWSFQGLYNYDGTKISDNTLYPCIRLWWDGDLLSESYNDGKIEKWDWNYKSVNRVATTWKITDCTGSDRGAPMFYGDILGDWREEVIMTSSDYSKLVILTTTSPTDERLYCLAQNPCYRNCMTVKGYYQSHMLDYYLGTDMEQPQLPTITIIEP